MDVVPKMESGAAIVWEVSGSDIKISRFCRFFLKRFEIDPRTNSKHFALGQAIIS